MPNSGSNGPSEIPAHGGHFHHFFCVDGDRLEVPEDQRFVPGPYRCPKCGKEYTGEKFEGALRRLVHGWLSQAALDLALVAALEEKPEYAAKSAEILLQICRRLPRSSHQHRRRRHDLPVAGRVHVGHSPRPGLRSCYTRNSRRRSGPKSKPSCARLPRESKRCGTRGNWGSWHLSAVGVVGYAIDDQDLVGWATERFKQQIRDQLGDDGLWPESVHTYHYFPLLAFMFFAEAAWHAGGGPLSLGSQTGQIAAGHVHRPAGLRLSGFAAAGHQRRLVPGVRSGRFLRAGLSSHPRPALCLGAWRTATSPGWSRRDWCLRFARHAARWVCTPFFSAEIFRSEITPPPATSINFPCSASACCAPPTAP